MQDETKKDTDDKLMTFIVADGQCFVLDVKSQSSVNDRKAEGIAATHKQVMKPYKDQGCKLWLYITDSCNTMRKTRSIVCAEEKCFVGGCMIHVEQNVAVFAIRLEVWGFQTARKNITYIWNSIFKSGSLYYLWKEYHGMDDNTRCGRPKSANSLEWSGELKKVSGYIDEKDNMRKLALDERNKSWSIDICNWILAPANFKTIYILEAVQIIFRRNQLFYSRMFVHLLLLL